MVHFEVETIYILKKENMLFLNHLAKTQTLKWDRFKSKYHLDDQFVCYLVFKNHSQVTTNLEEQIN